MINKDFVINSEQYQIKMRAFKTWLALTLAMLVFFGSIYLIFLLDPEIHDSAYIFAFIGLLFVMAFLPGCIVSFVKARNLLKNLESYRMYHARVKYCDQMEVRQYRYRGHMTTLELEILDEYLDNPFIKVRYEGRDQTIFIKENDVIEVAYSKELNNVLFDKKY